MSLIKNGYQSCSDVFSIWGDDLQILIFTSRSNDNILSIPTKRKTAKIENSNNSSSRCMVWTTMIIRQQYCVCQGQHKEKCTLVYFDYWRSWACLQLPVASNPAGPTLGWGGAITLPLGCRLQSYYWSLSCDHRKYSVCEYLRTVAVERLLVHRASCIRVYAQHKNDRGKRCIYPCTE